MKHFLAGANSAGASLTRTANPLLAGDRLKTVDVADITAPTVLVRPKRNTAREIRDLRRQQSARDAIAGFSRDVELYGFTKGKFSLMDLIGAIVEVIGPSHLSLSTWTAAGNEVQSLDRLVKSGAVVGMRWLLDFSFARRNPTAAHQIRQTFGLEAVRVTKNHAKFALFEADGWAVALRTSMNLNRNLRFEDFYLSHDPELAAFLRSVLDHIWSRQKRSLADATGKEQYQFFAGDE